ncbi:hypothetical protein MCAG_00824 [Micromonospora sp. ATCC 39149]|nr:hypothetical protein MCAG_00824 [Micromonospora sp. ATCC 39149]
MVAGLLIGGKFPAGRFCRRGDREGIGRFLRLGKLARVVLRPAALAGALCLSEDMVAELTKCVWANLDRDLLATIS